MDANTITTSTDESHSPTPAWNRLVELEDELTELLSCIAWNLSTVPAGGTTVIAFPVIESLRPRLIAAWDAAQAEEQADLATGWGAYPALLDGDNPWRSQVPNLTGYLVEDTPCPPLKIQKGVPCPPLDQ